jgi:type I restriction enzyme M protein
LFDAPASARSRLQQLVDDWGRSDGDEDDEEDGAPARKPLPDKKKKRLLNEDTWRRDGSLVDTATRLRQELGSDLFEDHNIFQKEVTAALSRLNVKLSATDRKAIVQAVSWRVRDAPPVIKKIHKAGSVQADPLRGLYEAEVNGKSCVVEFEPDSELRDFEQVPLQEPGGIGSFIRREVLPYATDAWIVEPDTRIGYEISFRRHFYKPPQLRSLRQISADILALERETEGLLAEIVVKREQPTSLNHDSNVRIAVDGVADSAEARSQ